MANIKTGFIFYKVDTDRFQDIRIKRLKKDRGCKGYAVYEYFLNEIYRVKGCFLAYDESAAFDAAEYWGLEESQVNDIVHYCCACGLFDKGLFTSAGILTSRSIQSRYIEMSRIAKRTSYAIPQQYDLISGINEDYPGKKDDYSGIMSDSSGSLPQSKGKESKENNNHPYPPFEEGIRALSVDNDSWKCNQQVREYLAKMGFECKAEIPVPDRGDGHAGRIDLTATRGDEKYAIEIDYLNPREKSIFKLRHLAGSFSKVILLRGGIQDGVLGGDIRVIQLKIKWENSTNRPDLEKQFEAFRAAYGGTKRGFQVEFAAFRKKHRDWQEVVPLLMPALERLIRWRERCMQSKSFCPQWAHLSTWLNQRRWEDEFPEPEDGSVHEGRPGVIQFPR